jgi:UDP-N-acetylmuramoyl-L-alanyl-D-glutamate--2,6-diaminopimelate ligase
MKLRKLLRHIPVQEIRGSKEIEITGLTAHSGVVAPGDLFVARKGLSRNGADFIPVAMGAGAVAVATDIYNPSLKGITQVIDPDMRGLEANLAAEFFEHPSRSLFVVGVTGTNGKTTTTFLIKHLLERMGVSCGLMGTIEYIMGSARCAAERTTPDVITTHKVLREMVLNHCQAAAMEVTSHALDQGRVSNVAFDVGVYTNLSQDHLDYHKTMEEYADAKAKLFSSGPNCPKIAVANLDDPWRERIFRQFKGKLLTYSLKDPTADLYASNLRLLPGNCWFKVTYHGRKVLVSIPLTGRFNVSNALAALAVGILRGADLEEVAPLLTDLPKVEGRLERVPNPLGLQIYVDFAHTPDALASSLEAMREITQGRLISVFGCGGNRDVAKRPQMGAIAAEKSDHTIITSDNPRNEDPHRICEEIVGGISGSRSYEVVADRREAIRRAVEAATPADLVLIAGKGHETSQIFAHRTVQFDDRLVVAELCKEKLSVQKV